MSMTSGETGGVMTMTSDGAGQAMTMTSDGAGQAMTMTSDGAGQAMTMTSDGAGQAMTMTSGGAGQAMTMDERRGSRMGDKIADVDELIRSVGSERRHKASGSPPWQSLKTRNECTEWGRRPACASPDCPCR